MVLQVIRDTMTDYYEQIPKGAVKKIALSALYTFAITFVFSKKVADEPFQLGRPLFAAAMASLASLIYALTMPIFNTIFGDDRLLPHRELIKWVVNIALCSVLGSLVAQLKYQSLSFPLLGSISVNLLKTLIDIVPLAAEHLFNDKIFAQEWRLFFQSKGLDCPDGSSSIFINFGVFPAIGLQG